MTKKQNPFLGKSWWNGVSCLTSLLVGLAGVFVSVKVYVQTERIHAETSAISMQMSRQAQIDHARDNIDKYLDMEWYDKAVWENNGLNDSLRAWGMAPDSSCFWYFKELCAMQEREGIPCEGSVTQEYLRELR